ncbi:hypothetical protein IWW50_002927, partial [Coemansia erecta]
MEGMRIKMEALIGLFKRCGLTDAYLWIQKPKKKNSKNDMHLNIEKLNEDSENDAYLDEVLEEKGKQVRKSTTFII